MSLPKRILLKAKVYSIVNTVSNFIVNYEWNVVNAYFWGRTEALLFS